MLGGVTVLLALLGCPMEFAKDQSSLQSPYLFNIYIDQLNVLLCNSRVGCHVAGKSACSFGYADDLALVAPSAKALNALLEICDQFADNNDITFSTEKSLAMLVHIGSHATFTPPPVFLSGSSLQYVDRFKYLGHIITADFKDDEDIMRELRNLNVRGNMLVRKFGFLSLDVKCDLFKTYCYPIYTCALWSRYNQASINRLKVAYNNIMRRLSHVPPWGSASFMFGMLGVRSFQEIIRTHAYSLMRRIDCSPNSFIVSLLSSDAALFSNQRRNWMQILH